MQQQMLKQQALLQQQSLYHPGILAPPQIEPIPSGNLPPGFDPSTCRSVYVGNIHTQATEPLLQEVFASTGPVESCKLVRREKPIGCHMIDMPSIFSLLLSSRHTDLSTTSIADQLPLLYYLLMEGHFNIFVGDLSPGVTDAMLFSCFSVYPSCSDARAMWDQKTWRSRGFGFVSFRNQQDAQSAINDLNGKWLDSRQIRCNWATKGVGTSDDKQSSDAKSVIELSNGSSEDGKETATNNEAPENNPQYTTVYVDNLAPEATKRGQTSGISSQSSDGFVSSIAEKILNSPLIVAPFTTPPAPSCSLCRSEFTGVNLVRRRRWRVRRAPEDASRAAAGRVAAGNRFNRFSTGSDRFDRFDRFQSVRTDLTGLNQFDRSPKLNSTVISMLLVLGARGAANLHHPGQLLPLPAAAPLPGLSATDLLAYERQFAMNKIGGVHALMHPQGQRPLKQATMGVGAAGASQAIYDGGFQKVAAAQQLMYYQ
ncbi:Oligouridylate-binding protein 1A [Hibiscus syriacus]|uniref:Oligouridylate-binding protein 1A n=1 Tax=Hibiscus syriacus TaxID=106335 RepID=A0A6A3C702_HIBSY|nr:Oligouridylate-binding protein 1A [Hibiscus syriacus]